MDKLVSIVLPTFNGEEFLAQSIESVLKQSYKNLELIIVNDCSTDSTPRIIEEFAKKDSRIKIIHNTINQKLPRSLNIGFNAASGEYWTWTSDDNYYLENAIEEMVAYLEENPNKVLVCTDYTIIKHNGFKEEDFIASTKIADLISWDSIGACFLYRAKVAKSIGEYDESQFKVEDYDYFLRLGLAGEMGAIHKKHYVYRRHPSSLTYTQGFAEVAGKTESLLIKYLPLYIAKYPNVDLDVRSQVRLCLINGEDFKLKEIWKNCSPKEKRDFYVHLRNCYVSLKDEKYLKYLYTLGLFYRIKFWIWLLSRKHKLRQS
ncbi:glycosyltransferase family 2 protein [Helicobacter sp. MIT 03-1614]|uniref:glycosyltransferase family 2 protein n=1 Tax=Helicobacter TaxID=209 RepID=UPI0005134740|nr:MULTISPECIES: glycosyltransferase family A protein [unclassified Helicobacter]TLD88475.1 glycosyltransferase family 2 protein [Helicobacter sp. MIT 03-1614]